MQKLLTVLMTSAVTTAIVAQPVFGAAPKKATSTAQVKKVASATASKTNVDKAKKAPVDKKAPVAAKAKNDAKAQKADAKSSKTAAKSQKVDTKQNARKADVQAKADKNSRNTKLQAKADKNSKQDSRNAKLQAKDDKRDIRGKSIQQAKNDKNGRRNARQAKSDIVVVSNKKTNNRVKVALYDSKSSRSSRGDNWVTYQGPGAHILRPSKRLASNQPTIERVSYRPSATYSNRPEPHQIFTPAPTPAPAPAPRLSAGERLGLGNTFDSVGLRSNAAFVVDESNMDVLFEKNSNVALPIASITKMMTALVVVEEGQDMNEILEITDDDVDRLKYSSSRLRVGTQLTRGEMLHLALMSSENRAASALGRNYPGGREAFVNAMNIKAQMLGMSKTHYVDTNGLSSHNVSTARDLAKLMMAASQHPLIRKYSTDTYYAVHDNGRTIHYGTTNGLVRVPEWHITAQKTGYISEAGQCLALKSMMNNRPVIMIFLDSKGKGARIADARRMRNWLVQSSPKYKDPVQTYQANRSTPSHSTTSFVEDDLYL